jgi:hypothetical protein
MSRAKSPAHEVSLGAATSLTKCIEKTRIAEEIDWIIKYFITFSGFAPLAFFSYFSKEQKDRVFISNIIQMNSQELEKMIKIGENRSNVAIHNKLLILVKSNCKFVF